MKNKNRFLEYYGLGLAAAGLGATLFALAAIIGRMTGHEVADWVILGSTFLGATWSPAGIYISKTAARRAELEVNR